MKNDVFITTTMNYDDGCYDYGARFYDPALGRWHVTDNYMENNFSFTPYNYVQDNPLRYIDPDGNWFWESKEIKNARKAARETGGEFHRWKNKETGTKYFSITYNNSDSNDSGDEAVVQTILFSKEKKEDWKLKNGIPYYGNNTKGGESGLPSEQKEEGVDMSEFSPSPMGWGSVFDLLKEIGIEGKSNNESDQQNEQDVNQNKPAEPDSIGIIYYHDDGKSTSVRRKKIPIADTAKYNRWRGPYGRGNKKN